MSENITTKEDILRLASTDIAKCMQCGRCTASCSVAHKMDLVPNRLVWALINGDMQTVLQATSPWQCQACFACEARCPRGVSPARLMEAVRLVAVRAQGGNRIAAEALENYPGDMPQQLLVAAFRKYNK